MEKKMESYRNYRGYIRVVLPPILENRMEKDMEHEMETGVYRER